MFAMHGFSILTALALIGGIVVHALKHFRQAKASGVALTIRAYVLDNWDTSAIAVISSLILWAGIPEIAQKFPEVASAVGVDMGVGIVSSFACGFIGNSLADYFGKRAAAVSGK